MKKKLVKIGNSYGLIIPPALLDLMGLKPGKETELELAFDSAKKALIITASDKKE